MARGTIGGNRRNVSSSARKGFQIEGLKEIQEKLAEVVDATSGREIKDVYLEAGQILRDQARANAPYDPNRKKGTHLRDAIFADGGDDQKPNALVGVRIGRRWKKSAPHAWLVEFGSAGKKAQPYLRPALTQTGPKIAETIKNGLLRIIEKAAK